MLPGHPQRVVVASLYICRWWVGYHDQTGRECQCYDPGNNGMEWHEIQHAMQPRMELYLPQGFLDIYSPLPHFSPLPLYLHTPSVAPSVSIITVSLYSCHRPVHLHHSWISICPPFLSPLHSWVAVVVVMRNRFSHHTTLYSVHFSSPIAHRHFCRYVFCSFPGVLTVTCLGIHIVIFWVCLSFHLKVHSLTHLLVYLLTLVVISSKVGSSTHLQLQFSSDKCPPRCFLPALPV